MNTISLLKIMGEMGCRYPVSIIDRIMDYTTRMLDNGRVIIIYKDNIPMSVLFFSMTDDPDTFLKKDSWDYLSHDVEGKIVYLEKIISREWNRALRAELESELIKKFPNFTHGIWHRWAKWGDRQVIAKRRDYVRN